MTDANATSRFRILSVEGGGILGAFAAGALAEMERATGRRIVEHFDLIAGTSTGGIIAIGLAMGLPAAQIRDFYVNRGREIFPEVGLVGRWLATARHLVRPKHTADRLERLLGEILTGSDGAPLRLGDARTRLLVPAYDGLSGRIYLFKTAHHPRFVHDIAIPAARVALATSAAPTYFKAMRVKEHQASYVDGGVWANCPALAAVVEAVSFLGQTPSAIDVLNVGTTIEPFNTIDKVGSGVAGWNRGLINLFMASQGEASRAMAGLLTGGRLVNVNYVSRNGEFSLDDPSRVEDLAGLGRAEAAKKAVADLVAERFLNGVPAEPFIPKARP
jgi:patatin-like phospholipase/acyl hydrolase